MLAKRTVYFDFDSAVIKGDGTDIVAAHAKYLSDHADARVRLEGNTDERGSPEYNIGLGMRRAQAVRQALLLQGASAASDHHRELRRGAPGRSGAQRGRLGQEPARRHRLPDAEVPAAASAVSRRSKLIRAASSKGVRHAPDPPPRARHGARRRLRLACLRIRIRCRSGSMISMRGSPRSSGSCPTRACCSWRSRWTRCRREVRDLRGKIEDLENSNRELQQAAARPVCRSRQAGRGAGARRLSGGGSGIRLHGGGARRSVDRAVDLRRRLSMP